MRGVVANMQRGWRHARQGGGKCDSEESNWRQRQRQADGACGAGAGDACAAPRIEGLRRGGRRVGRSRAAGAQGQARRQRHRRRPARCPPAPPRRAHHHGRLGPPPGGGDWGEGGGAGGGVGKPARSPHRPWPALPCPRVPVPRCPSPPRRSCVGEARAAQRGAGRSLPVRRP